MVDMVSKRARIAAARRGGSWSLRFAGDAHIDWYRAVGKLGSEKLAKRAFNRAVDHTGRKGFTRVKRVLARSVGLSQKRMMELGRVKFISARHTRTAVPTAMIRSTGRHLPLSAFRPKQFKQGVKASPWGRRVLFEGAFMFAGNRNSGQPMPRGQVFKNSRLYNSRAGRWNLAIPMWGPSVPKEMIEDAVAGEFSAVRLGLGKRVAHEVGVLTKGVVGK